MLIKLVVDERRAQKQHARLRGKSLYSAPAPQVPPTEKSPAGQVQVGPLTLEPWVHVVPGERLFEVTCQRCRGWSILYSVTVVSQPGLLQQMADEHAQCCEVAA